MKFPSRQPAVDDLPGVTGTVRVDRRTGLAAAPAAARRHRGRRPPRPRPGHRRGAGRRRRGRGRERLAVHLRPLPQPRSRAARRAPAWCWSTTSGPTCSAGSGTAHRVRVARGRGARRRRAGGGRPRARRRARSARQMDEARSGLATQLQSFTHNTTEFLRREQELLLHGQGVPETRTRIERPAGRRRGPRLRLPRGPARGCAASSASSDPVLVGVDAGADALLAAGHRPDIVVVGEDGLARAAAGDAGSTVSDKALRGAREVVAARRPLRPGGRLGAARPARRPARRRMAASGTSEDVALLLADVRGRQPDRRGRHARHPRRVPRPAARRAGQHLPDPAPGRPAAGRRQGRPAAVRRPGAAVAPAAGAARRAARPGRRDRRDAGGRRLVVVDRAAPCSDVLDLDPRTVHVISFRYHIVSIVVGLPGARRSASRSAAARSRARSTTPWSTR